MVKKFFLTFNRKLSGFNASSFPHAQTLGERKKSRRVSRASPSPSESLLLSHSSLSLNDHSTLRSSSTTGLWAALHGHLSPLLCRFWSFYMRWVYFLHIWLNICLSYWQSQTIAGRKEKMSSKAWKKKERKKEKEKSTYFNGILRNLRAY